MAKTAAQLDKEIVTALVRRRSGSGHATVITAEPHVEAIYDAIYRSKDPDALIVAVREAKKHVAAMRKIALKKHPGGGYVDSSGEFDPKLHELANLLVRANEMVRRIKIQRKTGRLPKPSRRTAWKLR